MARAAETRSSREGSGRRRQEGCEVPIRIGRALADDAEEGRRRPSVVSLCVAAAVGAAAAPAAGPAKLMVGVVVTWWWCGTVGEAGVGRVGGPFSVLLVVVVVLMSCVR